MTLKQFMPNYYFDIREMNTLLEVEDKLFLQINYLLNRFKDNQFIMTADEKQIQEYENILDIISTPDESLEFRRYRVLSRWIKPSAYTKDSLNQMIAQLQGNNNFDIHYDYEHFTIELTTRLAHKGQVEAVISVLKDILPANIAVIHKNKLDQNITGQLDAGAGIYHWKEMILE
ncbi:putative phage tail protein [Aerococcaceae bacterium 50-4]